MIDIHSHVVFSVDDGSDSVQTSVELIKKAKKTGVTDLICTPHFRLRQFEAPVSVIEKNFACLKNQAQGLGVNLYLGQEIALKNLALFRQRKFLTLAGSRYVLLEFDYNNYVDIDSIVYDLKIDGYIPVIAHVERYAYVTSDDVRQFVKDGAKIQINADSVCDGMFSHFKRKVMKYLKLDLVDFVASDMHSHRPYKLAEAYSVIVKKFGQKRADNLFENNPRNVINDAEF
ncbi:MAG: tyrosine-protein phosphatase [Christensenellaceae bacterium]